MSKNTPVNNTHKGHYNPLTLVIRDTERIFREMGFTVASGPEIESEWYNFDALNVPKDHPARDMQDTFHVKTRSEEEKFVLRTHTSNTQIRYAQTHTPPFRIIVPGRCFRAERTDARHEAVFYQVEGMAIDTNITLGHLRGVLEKWLSGLFGSQTEVRMRPGYFPFVEPGVEVDARCVTCGGSGTRKSGKRCAPCKGTGWLELMGAGMTHPKVLLNAGIDPKKYQGFAFGCGIERLAMVKYGVDDVRLFSSGDLRLVNQF